VNPEATHGGFGNHLVRDGKWISLSNNGRGQLGNWFDGHATGAYRTVITQGFRLTHVQHSDDPVIFYAWETAAMRRNDPGSSTMTARATARSIAHGSKDLFTPLKEWVTHEAWVKDTGEMR